MDTIVTKLKPLDWDVFWKKQESNTQVLKVSYEEEGRCSGEGD
jgi:hypothetical protein